MNNDLTSDGIMESINEIDHAIAESLKRKNMMTDKVDVPEVNEYLLVDPNGQVLAREKYAARAWQRIHGSYAYTIESILASEERGWKVIPVNSSQRIVSVDVTDKDINKESRLDKGQTWYVRFPKATTLAICEIVDLTEKTVAFKNQSYPYEPTRYARVDIEFIELVNAGTAEETTTKTSSVGTCDKSNY